MNLTVCPHSHDDDAGLGDDVLGELVEGGVGVVVEALQLLHPVVQVEKRPERLAVEAAVHRRRVKLEDGVVLTQSLRDKLREARKRANSRSQSSCFLPLHSVRSKLHSFLHFFKRRQKIKIKLKTNYRKP